MKIYGQELKHGHFHIVLKWYETLRYVQ